MAAIERRALTAAKLGLVVVWQARPALGALVITAPNAVGQRATAKLTSRS
jgi:hypothetical protein